MTSRKRSRAQSPGQGAQASSNPPSRRRAPFRHIQETLAFPRELDELLPRKWKRLGDAVVLKLPEELLPLKARVGEVYARALGVGKVFRTTDVVSDEFRVPSVERLFGEDNEVVNIENGISYCFDITRLMFSKGNTPERARVCGMDMKGEKVLDMFAGIGYFTLPSAIHGKAEKVVAVEKNPVAFSYLQKNIALNRCQDRVETRLGDNRVLDFFPDFDRVFMGYMFNPQDHLPRALCAISAKGGLIHYHCNLKRRELLRLRQEETIRASELPEPISSALKELPGQEGLELVETRLFKVKSYAPCIYHVVLDLSFEKT
jgi:tRNA wybutosine-synthesizing protein 2